MCSIATDTTLNEDHHGQVLISADNVTLDCAGHDVVGTGDLTGVSLHGRTGVRVRNCNQPERIRCLRVERRNP